MNIPEPTPHEKQALIDVFAMCGWLEDGAVALVHDETGAMRLKVSPHGTKTLVALYPLLMHGPDNPNDAGIRALIWFLNEGQKQHYPEGGESGNSTPAA